MCLSASMTVFAANATLTATGGKAERNDYVYVTVALEDCADANTLDITYEWDSKVLTSIPAKTSWTTPVDMMEFDQINKNHGVWYNPDANGIDGNICKLAFRVNENAKIGKTTVKCTVIVKDEAELIGKFTAEATIEVTCVHVAADDAVGTKVNDTIHKYNCENCNTEVTEDHIWDKGIITKPATEEETGIKEYTCTFCKATKTEELPKLESDDDGDEPGGDTPGGDEPGGDTPGGDEPGGDTPGGDEPGGSGDGGNQGGTTTPEENKPTKPVTKPETNKPISPNPGGSTTPETEVVEPDDTQEPETEDVDTPDDEVETEKPGNDDVPSDNSGGNAGPIIGVIGVIAAIAVGAFFFLKRK